MGEFGIGQPMRRKEDERFLLGRGRYVDDEPALGHLFGFVVRSHAAHAEIRRIEVEAARRAPGVRAVLTGQDYRDAGLGPLPCMSDIGAEIIRPERYPLQSERVRHVGDPVAFIVADSLAEAKDAADLVEVDADLLPPATDAVAALDADAPRLWPEAPHNRAFA